MSRLSMILQKQMKRSKNAPYLTLLIIFLIGSCFMARISLQNYKNTTLQVDVVKPIQESIDHEIQFFGSCDYNAYKRDFTIKWTMPKSVLAKLLPGDMVYIAKPEIKEYRNSYEKVKLEVQLGEFYEASVTGCYIDDECKEQYVTAKLSSSEFSIDCDEVVVQVNYTSQPFLWVVPASCIISDSQTIQKDSYVYVVKEEQKVWGTEYYLKKRLVEVIESNGEVSAITLRGDEMVVVGANDSRLNDEKIVRLNVLEMALGR